MSTTDTIFENHTKSQLQAKTRASRKKRTAAAAVEATEVVKLRNDQQPELTIVDRDIDALKPADRRTRKTTDPQLERVMRSLQTFQQMTPVIVDVDNRIVAGHIVWEAMRRLGAISIKCIVATHLNQALLRSYAVAVNRLSERGEWALKELRIELAELEILDMNLEITGFDKQEIEIIMLEPGDEESGENAEDDVDEDVAPVARKGDLFMLGKHRVLCADALEPESYATLMDTDIASCVFSDAPYNTPIAGNVSGLGKHKHQDFCMAVGEMSDSQFGDFLRRYLEQCRTWTSAGAVIFACMDWRQIDILLASGAAAGLSRINMAVWIKGGGMGALYRSAHELIAVFCNGDKPATNNVQLGKHGRDRTNVWAYPGANRRGSSSASALAAHPTPKPINLVADAIIDVTNRGEIVLDPFLGSGSTLIACEKAGRIARGIELDPKYIDVTIVRWQKYTGQTAVHVASGFTYGELTGARSIDVE